MLDDAAERTAARIAVAEVQLHHATWSMAQLRFEVHRALPVMKAGADGEGLVTEVARLAVAGRAGAEVVQVTAPDITDVTSLGVRVSDGGSIYRPPREQVSHDFTPRMCRKASFGIRARAMAPATKPSARAAKKLPMLIEPPLPPAHPGSGPACEMGRSLQATPISARYKGAQMPAPW